MMWEGPLGEDPFTIRPGALTRVNRIRAVALQSERMHVPGSEPANNRAIAWL